MNLKPNFSIVAEVESTLEGEDVVMGFDPGAIENIMAILSEVYSDPTGAVAREYTTNAIDSHIEAGQTRPVEITLPSVWQPNLIIQDFGVGMDADDIRNVYANYGASTKRHSDDFNGMLGIGSKSAFAYSNSFTVRGIKNGVCTVIAVSRDEYGKGVMKILSQTPTDEGNGVTITIPVSNTMEMISAVRNFAKYLPKGLVLVDGRDISERDQWTLVASDITDDDGNVIISNIWQVESQHSWNAEAFSRILMGNVAYEPITTGISDTLRSSGIARSYLIAEVPIGAVVFAPSRERLRDTPLTRRVEQAVAKSFAENIAKSMKERVEQAESPFKALQQYHATRGVISRAGLDAPQYKGKEIPEYTTVVAGKTGYDPQARLVGWTLTSYGAPSAHQYLSLSNLVNVNAIITNVPDDGLTTTNRRKARQLVNGSMILLPVRTKISKDYLYWLDGTEIYDFDDVKAVRLPRRSSGGGGGISTKGKHFTFNGHAYNLIEVPDDADIRYWVKSEVIKDWKSTSIGAGVIDDASFNNLSERLSKALPTDTLLVHVYGNRVDKFLKDYPQAEVLTESDASATIEAHVTKGITDDDIKAYASYQEFAYCDSLTYIPYDDEDRDFVFMYKSYDVSKVLNAIRLTEPTGEFRKKVHEASQRAAVVNERIRQRYPLLPLGDYYIRKIGDDQAVKRYFEADFNKYQEEQQCSSA